MKAEYKVGFLLLGSLTLLILFASLLGVIPGLSHQNELNILYNYAGGIEVGSPVRVMGIKVGKVKEIIFDPEGKAPSGEEAKLRIRISVDTKAWTSIRKDSKFFINLAGVIGEKFLEVSPGSASEPPFANRDVVRGEDPPRVDQLISQSYGLAGKVIDLVSKNEGTFTRVIDGLDRLTSNVNKTLVLLEKVSKNPDAAKLMNNTVQLSDDLVYFTQVLRSKDAQETFSVIKKLIHRLEPLDGPALKKFFQEEGIKAKMF